MYGCSILHAFRSSEHPSPHISSDNQCSTIYQSVCWATTIIQLKLLSYTGFKTVPGILPVLVIS